MIDLTKWRDPIDFADYLNFQIERVTDEIEEKKKAVIRDVATMTGKSPTIFGAARYTGIYDLTALYAELRRLYETQRAYEYYSKKEV